MARSPPPYSIKNAPRFILLGVAQDLDRGYCCIGDFGRGSCIDNGFASNMNGGNLTMRLQHITSLSNFDSFGAAAHLTDPYVTVSIKNNYTQTTSTATSSVVRNSLNPSWQNEPLNLGFQFSGDDVTLELWDADDGLEFAGEHYFHSFHSTPLLPPVYSKFGPNTSPLLLHIALQTISSPLLSSGSRTATF